VRLFDHPEYDHHEQVLFCRNRNADLFAIIAIHDTTLGPAAGGCRMWQYPSETEALNDVLRLSRAMSYKNALAGLPLGGGKSVIIGDPARDKNEKLLTAFARFVQGLAGQYWTAEDIGIGISDVEVLARESDYVFGLAESGVQTGDPSPFTARGCFQGIRAAVRHRFGRDALDGLKAAVQGVGNVGYCLCRNLREAGVDLVVSDVSPAAADRAVSEFGAVSVAPEEIYDQSVDIFCPCAMGGAISDDSIGRLQAGIVAGVANNQLAEPRHGRELYQRGILYAPDYVVNAGGMLNASGDIFGRYDVETVNRNIDRLYDTAREIFRQSEKEKRPTSEVADDLARGRIAAGKKTGD
jgi:leucine dehydrogenase